MFDFAPGAVAGTRFYPFGIPVTPAQRIVRCNRVDPLGFPSRGIVVATVGGAYI
jgi:hypothetical protein